MAEIIIEQSVRIVAALLMTLIGVLGTWLTSLIAKRQEQINHQHELQNVALALDELIQAAQQTVGELEQTVVQGMKAANLDGKLTEEEITALGVTVINCTKRKLSDPARRVLEAAAVDIEAVITSAAEDWINTLRMEAKHKEG